MDFVLNIRLHDVSNLRKFKQKNKDKIQKPNRDHMLTQNSMKITAKEIGQ